MRRGQFHTKLSQGRESSLRQHSLLNLVKGESLHVSFSTERGVWARPVFMNLQKFTRLVTDPPNYCILPAMLRWKKKNFF